MDTHLRIPRLVNDRIRNIAIAVIFGVLAAVLVVAYVHSYKKHVNTKASLVNVLVATSDLTPGMPGSEAASHLRVESIAQADAVQGAIQDKSAIAHLFVAQPIYQGEQITLRRFNDVVQTGVRGEATGKLRLMEIAGDDNQLLSGTLQAGDRVDVVASVKLTGALGQIPVTRTVLTGLKVVEVASKGSSSGFSGASSAALVLAVTNDQAQRLFYVLKNADWSLLYRPPFATSTRITNDSATSLLGTK